MKIILVKDWLKKRKNQKNIIYVMKIVKDVKSLKNMRDNLKNVFISMIGEISNNYKDISDDLNKRVKELK